MNGWTNLSLVEIWVNFNEPETGFSNERTKSLHDEWRVVDAGGADQRADQLQDFFDAKAANYRKFAIDDLRDKGRNFPIFFTEICRGVYNSRGVQATNEVLADLPGWLDNSKSIAQFRRKLSELFGVKLLINTNSS